MPQKFLSEFINPKTPYKGVLVYHGIGSGKTCTSIAIGEKFKHLRRILVVVPASLKGNYRTELRSPCAGNSYLTQKERDAMKHLFPSEPAYKELIKKSDERIDKYYTIYSYNKFVDLLRSNSINFRNTLLIIDEIHNMVSETGIYYEELYDAVHSAPDTLRLVLLSATPIFDKPIEIALTMNLLLRNKQIPTGSEFTDTFIVTKKKSGQTVYDVKNMDLFKEYVQGYVSYYRGAPPYVYPRSELRFVKTKMSDSQYKLYRKITASDVTDKDYLDIPNSFLINSRMVSNIVYPNGEFGAEGYESLEDDDLSLANFKEYSPKMVKIIRKIKKCEGTVFVYSNFKEYGGIKPFIKLLEHHRFKNYALNGTGPKRFAIFSGDQDLAYKDEIKAVFNDKSNEDGSRIKIIIASSAAKEGISLKRVAEVHIMEPYWNMARLEQIIGRAIRYCSHKDVPYDKQLVKVYIYLAIHPKIKVSVDQKIMNMAIVKYSINNKFEKALKEAAIDCYLFKNANYYKGEEEYTCET